MANSKDILVGLTIKPNENPEEITQSFDGESESVSYSKLTKAYKDLETDLKKHYKTFCADTDIIQVKKKNFS